MALAWTDGFDSYAAAADLTRKYASAGAGWTWSATAGRTGAGGIVGTGASSTTLMTRFGLPTNADCRRLGGFYIKLSAPPAADAPIYIDYNSGGTVGVWVGVSATTGTVYLVVTGSQMITGAISVADGQWHWVEFNCIAPGSFSAAGALYVDTIPQGSFSSANLNAGPFDHFSLSTVAGQTVTLDDVVLYNSNAGAPAAGDFPLGPRQITTTRPVSDGTCTFGTVVGGTGGHSGAVRETVPDGATSYVQDGTSGNQDLYNYSALGYTPANITAVMVNNYLTNPNAGSISYQAPCKSGATTALGASTLTPTIYQTYQTPFAVDPNTGAAWTTTALNAAQFGIKVV